MMFTLRANDVVLRTNDVALRANDAPGGKLTIGSPRGELPRSG